MVTNNVLVGWFGYHGGVFFYPDPFTIQTHEMVSHKDIVDTSGRFKLYIWSVR